MPNTKALAVRYLEEKREKIRLMQQSLVMNDQPHILMGDVALDVDDLNVLLSRTAQSLREIS